MVILGTPHPSCSQQTTTTGLVLDMPPEGAYIQLSQRNAAMFWELGTACQAYHSFYCF